MSKNKDNTGKNNKGSIDKFIIKDDDNQQEVILSKTEEQIKKITEIENQFGVVNKKDDLFDDATKIISTDEIEAELNLIEKEKAKDKHLNKRDTVENNETTNTMSFITDEVKLKIEEKLDERLELKNIYFDENIEIKEENMSRSPQRKNRNNKNNKGKSIIGKSRNKDVKAKKVKNSEKTKISKIKKTFLIFCSIALFFILIIVILGFAYIFGVFGKDKNLTREDLIIVNENSVVYDRSGELVATLVDDEKREIITLSDMPDYLSKMYIAIEDERFYKHKGVDFKRTISATLSYLLKGGNSGYGASTITQQLIKNITEDDERSWERKLREITRALQVEKEITKEEVLELYLNVIFVGGDNIHGVALGADYYFGKSQKDLTMAEAAFMAGINHMPNAYNPFLLSVDDLSEKEAEKIDKDDKLSDKEKEKAKLDKIKEENKELIENRTITVLDKIYKDLKWISKEDYETAITDVKNGFKFSTGQKSKSTLKYSYITDAAIDEVINMLMTEKDITRELAELQLYNGGYKIYTTQNSGMQKLAEDDMKDDEYRLTSNITKDENGKYVKSQASMTIIEQKSGQVIVAVGGLGEDVVMTKGDWNRTTRTLRQLGSSMKPIGVAAPGLESGILTAATVYDDTPFGGYNNFGYGYRGYTNIRKGIEVSNNIIFLKAIADMGVDTSADFLESVGFTIVDEDKNISSLALGGLTYGVSSTQVAGAYAAIANGGEYIEPTFVLKVEDSQGKVVLEPKQRRERVMSKQNAYILQKMMTSTVVGAEGTGSYAKVSGFETGVKTGTTNDDKDRWLCGFTPKLTAAVWYGFDVAEHIYWGGINPAGLIWRNNMRAIHNKYYKSGGEFEQPEGIVQISVCRDSGLLPCEFCKKDPRGSRVYTEYFATGTQPTEVCNHHEEVEVCKVSGLLPSENCKEKEKKVFLKKDNTLTAADLKYIAPIKECKACAKAEADNKNAASEFEKLIEALPEISNLKIIDEANIVSLNSQYIALSNEIKEYISELYKKKLEDSVNRIEEIKKEENKVPGAEENENTKPENSN